MHHRQLGLSLVFLPFDVRGGILVSTKAVHVGSTDWYRYLHVLLLDAAMTSATFYKSGRWDFVAPPHASTSATTTATPEDDNDGGGGGFTWMVAVSAMTACVMGVFRKRILVGSGIVGGSEQQWQRRQLLEN